MGKCLAFLRPSFPHQMARSGEMHECLVLFLSAMVSIAQGQHCTSTMNELDVFVWGAVPPAHKPLRTRAGLGRVSRERRACIAQSVFLTSPAQPGRFGCIFALLG